MIKFLDIIEGTCVQVINILANRVGQLYPALVKSKNACCHLLLIHCINQRIGIWNDSIQHETSAIC